jgi:hypothetical protein
LKFISAKICSKFFSESPVEIFHAQSGREISGQTPSVPAEARGLAGSRVAVQPWPVGVGRLAIAGKRRAPELALTGSFGRVSIGND